VRENKETAMDSRKPLTAGELEIDCGAFGKIRRASPPVKGDFAVQDGRLTLLGCIQRGLVTLSREELLPFLDAMDAQDAQIRTLNERIIELDLEVMEKCRRIDSLLTPPPDAAVKEAVEFSAEVRCGRLARGILHIGKRLRAMRADMASQTDALIAAMHAINDAGILMPDGVLDYASGVRAVQAPRMTPKQVKEAYLNGYEDGNDDGRALTGCRNVCEHTPRHDPDTAWAKSDTRAAFPEAFAGEVDRG
jgi:hypothetical protein